VGSFVVPSIDWGNGGKIWRRWVAWKAAFLDGGWSAGRANAGRSCWASGEDWRVRVEKTRWEAAGEAKVCLRRPGCRTDAMAGWSQMGGVCRGGGPMWDAASTSQSAHRLSIL
jgi:hypothetical protein